MKANPLSLSADLLERVPLMKPAWLPGLRALAEHPHAPRWNFAAGDRLQAADLRSLGRLRRSLAAAWPPASRTGAPPRAVLERVRALRSECALFRELIPEGLDLSKDWARVKSMARPDIAARLVDIVPAEADLSRLIVYFTAGTTGPSVDVPSHPAASGAYQVFLEAALRRHGVRPEFSHRRAACFQISCLATGILYPTALSAWNGAGFAKVNLHPFHWKHGDPARYFEAFDPLVITGDPVSFSELLRLKPAIKPKALVSTASTLTEGFRKLLSRAFKAPVIDWYSLTETGPIASSCPKGRGLHVLPHDVFVEAAGPSGEPVPKGGTGEILVTGGRNPYLPLLRFRTGDFGRIERGRCACGDAAPRIVDLLARPAALFRSDEGVVVNPIDLARALRPFPIVQHQFLQRKDRSCRLAVKLPPGPGRLDPSDLEKALRRFLGPGLDISVVFDPELGKGSRSWKVHSYLSELPLAPDRT